MAAGWLAGIFLNFFADPKMRFYWQFSIFYRPVKKICGQMHFF